ncbi:hypothetical protein [uncultured Jannaschia sp.]|uniref:hypothetical protein n=1 Tax=uncultured Jannaschia sp. TaxID=293347 RepID=UPI002609C940|nr:hypothetical protein [uncultured Jannaschia sp.]
MIAWKIMRADPATGRIASGADSRLTFDLVPGAVLEMPGQGIWMSLQRSYVETHYACHDANLLLELDFDPETLIEGNLSDAETEFSVPRATVRSITILPSDD